MASSQAEPPIKADMLIGDAVSRFPATAAVFTKYGLHCVGCFISPHETVKQGALGHGMPEQSFDKMLEEANEAAKHAPASGQGPNGNGASAGKRPVVLVSEIAAIRLKEMMEKDGKKGWGVRVERSGDSFQMDFAKKAGKKESALCFYGLNVFYCNGDKKTLSGAEIDFRIKEGKGAFVIRAAS